MNSRLIANAAKIPSSEPTERRNKTQKKMPDFSKIHKKEGKLLREKLLKADKGTSDTHLYKKLYPWEDSKEMAEHLKNTEVYNFDGLIALNKPYGIAQKAVGATSKQKTIVETLSSGSIPAHIPAMTQVLPHLKSLYAAEHLEIIKSTERWSSGLILLSTSPKVTEKVQKCLRRSKVEGQPVTAYQAVTVGLPVPVKIATKVGTQLEYIHNVGHVPVIVKKFSNTSVKLKKVRPAVVEHRALVYNKELDTSLLEVKTQVSKWHFLRVWLAHCYSPVLGDHLYSGRVRKLLSRRTQVSPHNVSNESQVLPDNLYSLLALPPREEL